MSVQRHLHLLHPVPREWGSTAGLGTLLYLQRDGHSTASAPSTCWGSAKGQNSGVLSHLIFVLLNFVLKSRKHKLVWAPKCPRGRLANRFGFGEWFG